MKTGTGIKFAMSLMLIFLTACVTAVRTEDVIESREDRLPFMLRFPGDSDTIKDREIFSLETRPEKTPAEMWKLARYYHIRALTADHLEKAMTWYGEISRLENTDAEIARNNTGCILSEMGRYGESEKLFQNILKSDPPLITAYYNLFILYKYSRRKGDAIKTLMLMREHYPESMYASVEMGDILYENSDYALAEKYYKEALQTGPGNPIPLYKLARLKEQSGHYTEAEDFYKRCIREFPYFKDAYLDYSGMLLKLNRKDEARSVLNEGVKRIKK